VGDKNKVIGIPALPNIQPNRTFILFYFFKKATWQADEGMEGSICCPVNIIIL
jgi:hypothetical protein